jgi:hypothetical protein
MMMTEQEREAQAAREAGHQMGCFETWADIEAEAGRPETVEDFAKVAGELGERCQCIDEASGYYLPDLTEGLAQDAERAAAEALNPAGA